MPDSKPYQQNMFNSAFADAAERLSPDSGGGNRITADEGGAERLSADAFDHIQALVRDGMRGVNEKEARIIRLLYGLDDGQRRTLDRVGQEFDVTRERIRQLKNRAIDALKQDEIAIKPLQDAFTEVSDFAERLGSPMDDSGFAAAFAKTSAELRSDAALIAGHMRLLSAIFAPQRAPRASLKQMDLLAIRTVIERGYRPVPLRELRRALRAELPVRRAMRNWPRLDLQLRLGIVLGIEMDAAQCLTPTERTFAAISAKEHRLAVINRALLEAGKPLHFSEISARVQPQLPRHRAMSQRNVHAWLDRYKARFKWVGPGAYGMAAWDIGVRNGVIADDLKSARRTGVGDEIALLLAERQRPLHIKEIESHIVSRFLVKRSSIHMSIMQDKAERFVFCPENHIGLSLWPSPCDPQPDAD